MKRPENGHDHTVPKMCTEGQKFAALPIPRCKRKVKFREKRGSELTTKTSRVLDRRNELSYSEKVSLQGRKTSVDGAMIVSEQSLKPTRWKNTFHL